MIKDSKLGWFGMPELIDWIDKKDLAAAVFIVAGGVFAANGSIKVREISFIPLSFGLTVLFLSIFVKLGRRDTLSREGISYKPFVLLAGFALSFFVIGVIIPLIQGG